MENNMLNGEGKSRMILIALLIFALGAGIGLLLGVGMAGKIPISSKSQDNMSTDDMSACIEKARERLAENGFVFNANQAGQEKNYISGSITSISGNTISIKTRPRDPLADPALNNKAVKVDDATKIFQLVESNGQKQSTTKINYQNKEAKISDLAVGNTISVKSESEIGSQINILAKEIYLLPSSPTQN